ncbi:hypothetical protein DNTS_021957 [Danionella cerebrum]|uniref:SEA domain-containing protein n=1 Tax=Danionella cerebrum TaxID=2873325 RepID=A0A553QLK9_9TELE|nr:hypothetical protein DNTS_021957 [Danionella translucida]
MEEAVELKILPDVSDNNNVSSEQTTGVNPGNGAHESSTLLSAIQVNGNNGDPNEVDGVVVDSSDKTSKLHRELQSLKEDLSEVVVWKFRLWMVILFVIVAILLGIVISIIVCAVEVDADENYDKSSFVVGRFFKGNFTLSNSTLEQESLMNTLNQQLTDVYSASPALERYFSNSSINGFKDTTAQFELQFLMPLEHEEVLRFPLSLKMVKNILLQHFYDQDSGGPLFVIPTSLRMEAY